MDRRIILSVIVLSSFILLLNVIPVQAEETFNYTPSTVEVCDGDTCTMTLYSGVRFIDEDGWKPIEQANSLKGVWNIVYIEYDEDFLFQNIEYNYTDISFDMNFTGEWEDYPEYCDYNEILNEVKCKFKLELKYDDVEIEGEYEFEWEPDDDNTKTVQEFKYESDTVMGKKFKFGGDSTTITLKALDGEVSETAVVNQSSPTTNYDSINTFDWMNETDNKYYLYIKFDISSIPSNITIDSALLTQYGEISDSCNYQVRHVYNQTWTGDTITWNDQPCDANLTNSTNCNLTAASTYTPGTSGSFSKREDDWTLTTPLQIEYASGDDNFSMILNASPIYYSDYVTWGAREDTYSSLKITYSYDIYPTWYTNQSSVPTTYSTSQTFDFNITWNVTDDSFGNITHVWIEHNMTGAATNYTMSNSTYGQYIFNYTYSETIGAGDYYWKSFANTTEGVNDIWNESDTWTFTIGQAPPIFSLIMSRDNYVTNTTNANITGDNYDTFKITNSIDSTMGTLTQFLDGSAISNPYSSVLSTTTHTVKVNTSGNTNYSSNSTGLTYYILVSLDSSAPTGGGGSSGGGATFVETHVCDLGYVYDEGLEECRPMRPDELLVLPPIYEIEAFLFGTIFSIGDINISLFIMLLIMGAYIAVSGQLKKRFKKVK